MMEKMDLLEEKKILIVDDEPDVLVSLEEMLRMCKLVKATNFNEAKNQLETDYFDMAILDIMGVDGYELLKLANQRKVTAVMLTAHALSTEDTEKSYREGAAFYVPKEEMSNIAIYLTDILEALERGKSPWWRWLDRMGAYYDKKFGKEWKDRQRNFWDEVQF